MQAIQAVHDALIAKGIELAVGISRAWPQCVLATSGRRFIGAWMFDGYAGALYSLQLCL